MTLVLALHVVAIAWVALVWISFADPSRGGALTLVLATLVLPAGSQAAGPLVALTFLTALTVASANVHAPSWTVMPHPGDARWIATWIASAAMAGIALALAGRDPARRSRRRARTALKRV
jgi:hypothetical protein